MALLDGKVSYTQLGLATLLKCFQYEGRFPSHKRDILRSVVAFIAQQLAVNVEEFAQYKWEGRTIKGDRATIREYLGFREASEADRVMLMDWLAGQAEMRHEHREGYWLNIAYHRLRELHIEPFSPEKMERAVRSALNSYQDTVCEVVYARLSEEMKQRLEELLETDPSAEQENPWSRLAKLKDDPGGVDLKNVLEAGEKLRSLRAIGLPLNVLEDIDPKWVEVYRQRAVAEYPSDLKAHPAPIRYTLLAALCHVRQVEITDQLIDLLIQIIHKIGTRAERKIAKVTVKDIQRVYGKGEMLFKMAKASLSDPQGSVEQVIFGVVSEDKLQRVVQEREAHPLSYRQEVGQVMRRS
jgi:hypothetical protein